MSTSRLYMVLALLLTTAATAGTGCACQGWQLQPHGDAATAPDATTALLDAGSDAAQPSCHDDDGDGYGAGCARGPDCDDSSASAHPGQPEICDDGLDNDCDPLTTDTLDCHCAYGQLRDCYDGREGTAGHSPCRKGMQRCLLDGAFGPCEGQVVPTGEACNGIDDSCDGIVDDGVLNVCGTCGAVPDEVCGNGLDDNCDSRVDEASAGCSCDPQCLCVGTACVCHPPSHQPCYEGLPVTAGVGACHQGYHDCLSQGGGVFEWGPCDAQQLPVAEACGNGVDDDCDGLVDEACGPPSCIPVFELCNGLDDDCDGIVDEGVTNGCGDCGVAGAEVCGNGYDDDCDGQVDEASAGCICVDGAEQDCYRGPAGTRFVGACHDGRQGCSGGESAVWGDCSGDQLPTLEQCGDGVDNDCDGHTDEGCGCQEGSTRLCGTHAGACTAGVETCHQGTFGGCTAVGPGLESCNGVDDDCDGLVDEGTLNACGRCPNADPPCFTEPFTFPAIFDSGEADGVSTHSPTPLDPLCAGQALCLNSASSSSRAMWLAGTNQWWTDPASCTTVDGALANQCYDTVIKMDTRTGAVLGTFPSFGWSPSRTAVNTLDGSVWVGNRGCRVNLEECRGDDVRAGNAVHLSQSGQLICRADVTDATQAAVDGRVGVRALALDGRGDVWVGMWNQAKLHKIDGRRVDPPGADGIPVCRKVLTVDLADAAGTSYTYGAAVDGKGLLWITTVGYGPLRAIDTRTGTIAMTVSFGTEPGQIQCRCAPAGAPQCQGTGVGLDTPFNLAGYGIAVDGQGNAWFGTWVDGTHGPTRVSADGTRCDYFPNNLGVTSYSRGVAVNANGDIFASDWHTNTLSRYSAEGAHLATTPIDDGVAGATGPLGVGIDADTNVWTIDYNTGHATQFWPDGALKQVFVVPDLNGFGPTPAFNYTYSDFTGIQNRFITNHNGSWTIDYDSAYPAPRWRSVRWRGIANPPTTRIAVEVRSAATRDGLLTQPYSVELSANPANILGLVPDLRWLQVRVILSTDDPTATPVLQELDVDWEH